MASGLPSVVSDVGGCQEIIKNSKGGLIAKAKDPNDFYEKCNLLVENNDKYNEYRRNGLDFSRMNSWNFVNERVIDLYGSIVKEDNQ